MSIFSADRYTHDVPGASALSYEQRIALAGSLDVPDGLGLMENRPDCEPTYEDNLAFYRNASFDYREIGGGGSRSAFSFKGANSVFKLPLNTNRDAKINQLEVAYYEQDAFYGHPVVPCRLLWTQTGIPIVVMEKVEIVYDDDNMPHWSKNIDCEQVAYSPMLKCWACYDAGWPTYNSDAYQAISTSGSRLLIDNEWQRLIGDKLPSKPVADPNNTLVFA